MFTAPPLLQPVCVEGPDLLKAGRHKNGKAKGKHSNPRRACSSCRVTLSGGRCVQRMCCLYLKEQNY